MKDFILNNNTLKKFASILIWLLIWQFANIIIGEEMLLASPLSVATKLLELIKEPPFCDAVFFSLYKIFSGFLLALVIGIILGAIAYRFYFVAIFLEPFMSIVKTAPVVSYIILCLLFLSSKNLSISVSFLMALPVIYTNILKGLNNTNKKLLEMASVFKVSTFRKVIYIYISELMPFLISACSISIGLSFKSGIAAEVIGLPIGSLGEQLYQAKVFVDTSTVIALTIVIILLSFICEKITVRLISKITWFIGRV